MTRFGCHPSGPPPPSTSASREAPGTCPRRADVAPYQRMLRTLAQEFEDCPDAVLVDMVSDHESIQVIKKSWTSLVTVDAEDTHVRVAFPDRTVAKLDRFLEL